MATLVAGGSAQSVHPSMTLYKQSQVPTEMRVDDLLRRMTLTEKVRQLDLYAGAKDLVGKHLDHTHADPDAVFLPEEAEALWGDVGVGGIHDLYPTPEQANAIQRWVISHNRLGITAHFIEEALHGYYTGTVYPAPIWTCCYLGSVDRARSGSWYCFWGEILWRRNDSGTCS